MSKVILDRATLTRDLAACFDATDPAELVLDPSFSAEDLEFLCRSVAGAAHADWVFERIAAHAAADEHILHLILTFSGDEGVANTIATGPHASISLLTKLSRSPHARVREHATVGLVARDILPRGDSQELHELLDRNQGHEGAALGVRWFVAQFPDTPRDVLSRLADDNADIVASAARKNLGRA